MAEVTVSSKFQFVIPREVREETGIKVGEKVVVIVKGLEQTLDQLKNVYVDAYSSEQARMLSFKKYPILKDYYQMGWEVEARLDKEELQRRTDVEKSQKEQEEKQIQNSWWNQ